MQQLQSRHYGSAWRVLAWGCLVDIEALTIVGRPATVLPNTHCYPYLLARHSVVMV